MQVYSELPPGVCKNYGAPSVCMQLVQNFILSELQVAQG